MGSEVQRQNWQVYNSDVGRPINLLFVRVCSHQSKNIGANLEFRIHHTPTSFREHGAWTTAIWKIEFMLKRRQHKIWLLLTPGSRYGFLDEFKDLCIIFKLDFRSGSVLFRCMWHIKKWQHGANETRSVLLNVRKAAEEATELRMNLTSWTNVVLSAVEKA